MPDDTLLTAALYYASLGWHIFPCKPGAKEPLTKHGVKDATTDEETIREWWAKWPDANVAMACGKKSGYYVVDIDVDADKGVDGWNSLVALEKDNGLTPPTILQETPRGGAHLFYRTDRPPKNKNSLFPGIDIRGDGYYVVLAPSIHPNGKAYAWEANCGPGEIEAAEFPDWLRPPETRTRRPWEWPGAKPAKAAIPPRKPQEPRQGSPIEERARAYLRECEPAVQGQAGHDKLLWAARAIVIGFELGDETAKDLLWQEFNPRCSPQWDRGDPREARDFERKVEEARRTPGEKPVGWLKDECGLRSGDEALQALGKEWADNILASVQGESVTVQEEGGDEAPSRVPFPVDCFPPKVREYIRRVAEANAVYPEYVGLPVLTVGGAAIGNALRLMAKVRFIVPPTLWGIMIGDPGANKSAPMECVVAPMHDPLPMPSSEAAMVTPAPPTVFQDLTLESVVNELPKSPRGGLVAQDEIRAWLGTFNKYRDGADEQAWISFWNAKDYILHRKTNDEHLHIRAAAVSVLGTIQPEVLAKSFDPEKFASGLVPRALVVHPPFESRCWTEVEITDDIQNGWAEIVNRLRTIPFASMNPATAAYNPHVLQFTPEAKRDAWVPFYNAHNASLEDMDRRSRLFASKYDLLAARIILILHGITTAIDNGSWESPISLETTVNGIRLARWFMQEAFRVYGLASSMFEDSRADKVVQWIRTKGGKTTVRDYYRAHSTRYSNTDAARDELKRLAENGKGSFDGKSFVLKEGEG